MVIGKKVIGWMTTDYQKKYTRPRLGSGSGIGVAASCRYELADLDGERLAAATGLRSVGIGELEATADHGIAVV